MDKNRLPAHIAVIMDGNGRWAKKRGLPRIMGHKEGAESVRVITESCAELGIKYLTFYAFSTENWKRPEPEVKFLMSMLDSYLKRERVTIMKNNIRFKSIGDRKKLPAVVVKKINMLEKESAKNTGLTMILALNYGSRDEIKNAVVKIAKKVKKGETAPSEITEKMIEENLYTKGVPDPDLMIRTSGEMRISNFLLWQLAYSELYITATLWPDFRKKELVAAIENYQARDRRFGGLTNG
ncbi:MAG: Ditrans,polycis-undecaprenyl-diphosphate synthase ((2E,6E)-farnesyl-diphosphate specific) [Candidatus Aerophobetes bacterium ADurb.Bin490]|nr:MAG: Ditrans,polycis-undecaprenyl-diphosphate synthase ((2E,6E)-farnesyl-diphosphate specific) [Candidatus Aerophobetes bacterium ADurb.Bin490]